MARKNLATNSGKRPDNAVIPAGFKLLPGYLDSSSQRALMCEIGRLVASAPLYRPAMPRSGKPFSICMTNCGPLGWVSDRSGYRYQAHHPFTGAPWPPMPQALVEVWHALAGFPAPPEACLINHYTAGTKLGSHVDADEAETAAPVISISLGDDAIFHVGGLRRSDPKTKFRLRSGDIVILGGDARLAYHGLDRIVTTTSDIVPWGGRINLTLRRVSRLDS